MRRGFLCRKSTVTSLCCGKCSYRNCGRQQWSVIHVELSGSLRIWGHWLDRLLPNMHLHPWHSSESEVWLCFWCGHLIIYFPPLLANGRFNLCTQKWGTWVLVPIFMPFRNARARAVLFKFWEPPREHRASFPVLPLGPGSASTSAVALSVPLHVAGGYETSPDGSLGLSNSHRAILSWVSKLLRLGMHAIAFNSV